MHMRLLLLVAAAFVPVGARAQVPALRLTKTDLADPATTAAPFAYVLTLTNSGVGIAANPIVTDVLPAGVSFVSATTTRGSVSTNGGPVVLNVTNLHAGQSAIATVWVQAVASGEITNVARLAFGGATNEVSETTIVLPDLRLTARDSADPVSLDESFAYVLAVSNASAGAITNVVVTNALPGPVEHVASAATAGSIGWTGGVVRWQVGALSVGGTATATVQVRAAAGGVQTNRAVATGQNGATSYTALARETTRVLGPATDLTGDGLGDLLLQSATGNVYYLMAMSDTNGLGGSYLFNTSDVSPWIFSAASDVDGDGTADLVFRDRSVHAVGFLRTGHVYRTAYLYGERKDLAPWKAVAGGDFNGDGFGDLLYQRGREGVYAAVLQQSNRWISAGYLFGSARDLRPWRIVGAGDTDADGVAELVARRGGSRVYGILFVDGWAVLDAWYLTGAETDLSPWAFRAATDLDGDGFDELVFQDGETNAFEAAYVDGFTILRSRPLLTNQGGLPGWSLLGPK